MPSHACAGLSCAAGMAKILSAGPATTLAISTFFARPITKRRTPYAKSSSRTIAARELIGDVAVPDDRAGDQLRKEQQVQRGVHRALLRDRVAAVDVDDVRDRVEGEERDADRQQHARHDDRLHAQRQEQRVDVVGEEVRVLEDAEDDEIRRDREGEQRPGAARVAPAIDGDRDRVVEGNRRQHQPGERARRPSRRRRCSRRAAASCRTRRGPIRRARTPGAHRAGNTAPAGPAERETGMSVR